MQALHLFCIFFLKCFAFPQTAFETSKNKVVEMVCLNVSHKCLSSVCIVKKIGVFCPTSEFCTFSYCLQHVPNTLNFLFQTWIFMWQIHIQESVLGEVAQVISETLSTRIKGLLLPYFRIRPTGGCNNSV